MIIGFTGRAGCGKSTAALHLVQRHGFIRVRFAGPLKAMLLALGLTPEHVDGSLKEQPCELLCGKSPRQAMQTLGTEWGREIMGGDFWVSAWQQAAQNAGPLVVVDDVRFANEADAIRAMGGVVIKIERPETVAVCPHASESGEARADFLIRNDADVAAFLEGVDEILA